MAESAYSKTWAGTAVPVICTEIGLAMAPVISRSCPFASVAITVPPTNMAIKAVPDTVVGVIFLSRTADVPTGPTKALKSDTAAGTVTTLSAYTPILTVDVKIWLSAGWAPTVGDTDKEALRTRVAI